MEASAKMSDLGSAPRWIDTSSKAFLPPTISAETFLSQYGSLEDSGQQKKAQRKRTTQNLARKKVSRVPKPKIPKENLPGLPMASKFSPARQKGNAENNVGFGISGFETYPYDEMGLETPAFLRRNEYYLLDFVRQDLQSQSSCFREFEIDGEAVRNRLKSAESCFEIDDNLLCRQEISGLDCEMIESQQSDTTELDIPEKETLQVSQDDSANTLCEERMESQGIEGQKNQKNIDTNLGSELNLTCDSPDEGLERSDKEIQPLSNSDKQNQANLPNVFYPVENRKRASPEQSQLENENKKPNTQLSISEQTNLNLEKNTGLLEDNSAVTVTKAVPPENIVKESPQKQVEIEIITVLEDKESSLDLEWLRKEDPDKVRQHLMSFGGEWSF